MSACQSSDLLDGGSADNAYPAPSARSLSGEGGAIYNEGTLTVSNCFFNDNSANVGGGIYNNGSLTVNSCEFEYNSATDGGGIFNNDTMRISNSDFNLNSGEYGAAVFQDGNPSSITDSSFLNSTGSALACGGVLTVTGCTFDSNNNPGNFPGGAITNTGNGNLTVNSSTFSNNSGYQGGAIYNAAVLIANNSTFSGNAAQVEGGAIFNGNGPAVATLTSCTVSGNGQNTQYTTEFGGGILQDGELILHNSIVAANTATYNTAGGDLAGDADASSSYNLIGPGYSGTNLQPTQANHNIVFADPLMFTDPVGPLGSNGGPTRTMALVSGSAALGAGDPVLAGTTDQRGVTRPSVPYGEVDIGAFQADTLILTPSSLPDGLAASAYPDTTIGVSSGTGTGDTVTYAVTSGSLPSGMMLDSSTGLLHGTPSFSSVGTFNFTVTATDSTANLTGLQKYTLVVDSPPIVSVTAVPGSVAGTGSFVVNVAPAAAGPLQVTLTVDATKSDLPTGYNLRGSGSGVTVFYDGAGHITVDFAPGATLATINLTPSGEAETNHSLQLDVQPGTGYLPDATYGTALLQVAANGLIVTDTADSGDGSLRQAITNADALPGGGTITFDIPTNPSTGVYTITLAGALPTLNNEVKIVGPGAATLTIDGLMGAYGGTYQVFNVAVDATALVSGLNIINGNGAGAVLDLGGAIYNAGNLTVSNCNFSNDTAYDGGAIGNYGSLDVEGCTFTANGAAFGGAIANFASLSLSDDTFAGNMAGGAGGGIFNSGQGSVIVTASTFSGNSSSNGGGIFNNSNGSVTLVDSIVANSTGGGDLTGSGYTGSYDLIGDGSFFSSFTQSLSGNPLLAPLGNYGGPTGTFALLPGSPAIDAGTSTYLVNAVNIVPTTDQRGLGRVGAPDIGAFESQGFTLAVLGSNNQSTAVNTSFATPLTVLVTANKFIEPVTGGVVTFTAPTVGASATITGSPVTIGSNGEASVTATANNITGVYSVTANTNGASSGVGYSLANVPPGGGVVTWINPAGGDWDNPNNWIDENGVNRLPNANDLVFINYSYITVTHSSAQTDSVYSLTSDASLNITGGGSLDVAAASTVTGNLSVSNATLGGSGAIAAAGGSTLSNATLDGCTLTIPQGQSAVLGAGTDYLDNGSVLDNQGTLNIYGATVTYDGSAANLQNQGTIYTDQTSYLDVPIDSTGPIIADNGTLVLGGSGITSTIASIDATNATVLQISGQVTVGSVAAAAVEWWHCTAQVTGSYSADNTLLYASDVTMTGQVAKLGDAPLPQSLQGDYISVSLPPVGGLELSYSTLDLTGATLLPGSTGQAGSTDLADLALFRSTLRAAAAWTVSGTVSINGELDAGSGSGSVLAKAGASLYQGVTLSGYQLTIPQGQSASVQDVTYLDNGSVLDNQGTLTVYGTGAYGDGGFAYDQGSSPGQLDNEGTIHTNQNSMLSVPIDSTGPIIADNGSLVLGTGTIASIDATNATVLQIRGQVTVGSVAAAAVEWWQCTAQVDGSYSASNTLLYGSDITMTGTVAVLGDAPLPQSLQGDYISASLPPVGGLELSASTLDLTAAKLAPGSTDLVGLALYNSTLWAAADWTVSSTVSLYGELDAAGGAGMLTADAGASLFAGVTLSGYTLVIPQGQLASVEDVTYLDNGSVLDNQGTLTVSGTGAYGDGGFAYDQGSSPGQLDNEGTIHTNQNSMLSVPIDSTGDIIADNGSLVLGVSGSSSTFGGSVQAAAGTFLDFRDDCTFTSASGVAADQVEFDTGTVAEEGGYQAATSTTLNSAQLNFSGSVTALGVLAVADGTIAFATPTPASVTASSVDLADASLTANGNLLLQDSGAFTMDSASSLSLVLGTQSDQIDAGPITLGGTLNVSLTNGFVPTPGGTFTLLHETGSSTLSGAFNGLPEGATLTIGSDVFQITYKGGLPPQQGQLGSGFGAGSDVVLTNLMSNPGNQTSNEGDSISLPVAFNADLNSLTATGLPAGLSLGSNGTISGTIDPRGAGTYPVVVDATFAGQPESVSFNWTVNDTTPPALTSPGNQSDSEDYTITPITIAAIDADPGSFTATGLPSGLSISGAGIISGSIAANAAGNYNVVVSASDGGVVGQTSFSWTVINPLANLSPLTVTPIRNQSFTGAVATFSDPDPAGPFTATINWNDGTAASAATVQAEGGGVYDIIGTHTYKTDGIYTPVVTVTDQGGAPSATVDSTAYVGGVATHFQVSASTAATAGSPFTVTVMALDGQGHTAYNYAGTVHFTTNNAQFTLPADYTFAAGDLGAHVFASAVTLDNAGTSSVTAADTVSGIHGSQNGIVVAPAAVASFTVTAPANATAGKAFNVVVTAYDAYGNRATNYVGTVQFTTSDPQVSSFTYMFTTGTGGDDGRHTFSITLYTSSTQVVTFTDTTNPGATGSASVTVKAAAAAKLVFGQQPTNVVHGQVINPPITVMIEDQYGNLVTTNTSKVTLSIASGPGTLGGTVKVNAVGGVATFSNLTISAAGSYTLKATDGALAPATSNPFQVASAALDRFFMDDETLPGTDDAVWPGSDARKPEETVAMSRAPQEQPLAHELEAMLPHIVVSRSSVSRALSEDMTQAPVALSGAHVDDDPGDAQQAGLGLAGLTLALFEPTGRAWPGHQTVRNDSRGFLPTDQLPTLEIVAAPGAATQAYTPAYACWSEGPKRAETPYLVRSS